MWNKSKTRLKTSEFLDFKNEKKHNIADKNSSGHSIKISISGVGSEAFAIQGKIINTTKNNNLFTV
jgi:hypothetical protein